MKIKIYYNITYIISRIALHNKPCMHMDGYFKIKIKCLNARMQSQPPPQQHHHNSTNRNNRHNNNRHKTVLSWDARPCE